MVLAWMHGDSAPRLPRGVPSADRYQTSSFRLHSLVYHQRLLSIDSLNVIHYVCRQFLVQAILDALLCNPNSYFGTFCGLCSTSHFFFPWLFSISMPSFSPKHVESNDHYYATMAQFPLHASSDQTMGRDFARPSIMSQGTIASIMATRQTIDLRV